jgi:hypothetical protein
MTNLDLIEAYYLVARHIHERAQYMLEVAEVIGKTADRMSEERMREKQPSDTEGKPAEGGK